MTPGNHRRLLQLYQAALNLGMSETDAKFYSQSALDRETASGDWCVVPRSLRR
jgi:hypothetical protein